MSQNIRMTHRLAAALGCEPVMVCVGAVRLPALTMIRGWPHFLVVDERGGVWAWSVARPTVLPSQLQSPGPLQ